MTVLLHKETVVDIVFSDIEMPGAVDGFGLAKWI
jgi:YesN/AraC family two-component response regulator